MEAKLNKKLPKWTKKDLKWMQNEQKIDPKRTRNDSKMDQKSTQNEAKVANNFTIKM